MAVAFFDLATLFLLTQTKAHNIPLFGLLRVQLFFLSKSCPHSNENPNRTN
jgi:ethanolaminephosphotransferase